MEPQPGQIWRHYKGGNYRVIAVAYNEPDGMDERFRVVVYQALQDGFTVWTRPVKDWFGWIPVEGNSMGIQRFVLHSYRLLP